MTDGKTKEQEALEQAKEREKLFGDPADPHKGSADGGGSDTGGAGDTAGAGDSSGGGDNR